MYHPSPPAPPSTSPPTPGMSGAAYPPPVGPAFDPSAPSPSDRRRPWWGIGDIWLGLVVVVAAATVVSIVAVVAVAAVGGDPLDPESAIGVSAGVLAVSAIGQQAAQGIWPLVVVKWKGRSRRDFGIRFRPIDLAYGLAGGLGGLVLAGLIGAALTALVGLEDPGAADNSQILTDNTESVWIWALIAVAVVGAPVTEELFFRGLALRAFQKRLGPAWALVLSTALFTLMHFQATSWEGLVVLFGTIGAVGALLGALALYTGRIGAAVVAHAVFNAVGVIAALSVDNLS